MGRVYPDCTSRSLRLSCYHLLLPDARLRHPLRVFCIPQPRTSTCLFAQGRRARCDGLEAPEERSITLASVKTRAALFQCEQDMDAWHRASSFSEAESCLALDGANGASVPCLNSPACLQRFNASSMRLEKTASYRMNESLRLPTGHKAGPSRSGAHRRGPALCIDFIIRLKHFSPR